jgi:DNA-binding LacI/PurR family transcriptional regulator
MPVTQRDIAEKVGVSRRLVGYALSGDPCVSAEMRQRIQETAQALGYSPNRAARALVTGRTNQIALCLPSLGDSFYAEVIRQFEMLTRAASYDLLITTTGSVHNAPTSLTVDGIVFYGTTPLSIPPQSCPVVMIRQDLQNTPAAEGKLIDSIMLDIKEAAAAAIGHLVAEGFQRIAFVAPDPMLKPHEPRYFAYAAAIKAAGLPHETIGIRLPIEGRVQQQAHHALATYFEQYGFPDALYCSNDDIAIGAYRALRQWGRPIPSGTAILGCDDISEAQDLTPALSSISLPLDDICPLAWSMLQARIENPTAAPQFAAFKGELVVRESSLKASRKPISLSSGE